MGLIDSVRFQIDNLFVPRDELFDQARGIVDQFDDDGDGRINIAGLRATAGVTGHGFAAADEIGNRNGTATVKEVRNLLKPFDDDRDDRVQGLEWLSLARELVAIKPTGVTQSRAGARDLA